MKKLLLILMLAIFSYSAFAKELVTKEKAIEIAKILTVKNNVNVYISKQITSKK